MSHSKDYSISLIRFIAFFSIVFCHIFQYLDIELAWWLNVGVQVFLCISGYLYSMKSSFNDISFYIKQVLKILIPYYIVVIPMLVIHILFNGSNLGITTIIKVLLFNDTLDGGGHLWFISTILFCYLITPFLSRYFDYCYKENSYRLLFGVAILICLNIMLLELFIPYLSPVSIICYILGFLLGYCNRVHAVKILGVSKSIIYVLALFNLPQIYLQYFTDHVFTGTLESVWNLFCNFNHVWLGLVIFIIVHDIFSKNVIKGNWIIRILDVSDKYSYDGYLVHQFLILGPFR